MRKYNYKPILFLLLGMVVGYFILHPYTMLVYALLNVPGQGFNIPLNQLLVRALMAFKPAMIPMAISFVFFGGLTGFLIGIAIDRKRQLISIQHEHEKRKIALKTLNQLMITLSHYLLNANMIIGGKIRRCRKAISPKDILPDLDVIEHQARRIDAVIGSLRRLTEVKTADYSTGGQVKMIDIAEEIEARLHQTNKLHQGVQRSQNQG